MMEDQTEFTSDEVSLVRPEVNALEAISRSEVAMQLDSAHRWPRTPTKFLRDATSLATYNTEIAEACMYSIPRGGKMIEGPSVRLAEICASSWGNLHVGARVIDETASTVVAQAVVWDLERNVRITVEAQRGILTSKGKRYDDDMVRVTGMAAISIALRNAVFRVIPRAYLEQVYGAARAAAVGDAQTLTARRDKWMASLAKMGVPAERVFARLGVLGVSDIGLDHIATLIGIAQAIKSGDIDVDTAFPPVPTPTLGGGGNGAAPAGAAPGAPTGSAAAAAPEGRRVKVGAGKRGVGAPPGASGGEPPAAEKDTRERAVAGANTTGEKSAAERARPQGAPAAPPGAPAAEAGVGVPALLGALAQVDDAWRSAPDGAAIVATWSEAERGAAWAWARAVLVDAPLAEQMRRPAFTLIDGPPDDDEGGA